MRLDKFLSEMGIGTRSEVKKLLKSQKVTVNGETITKPETKIDTDKDIVCYNNKQLVYENMNIICFISLPDAFRLQRIIFTKLLWIT